MATISLQSNWLDPLLTNTLFLIQDGVIINTGGDVLVHVSNGYYTTTVTETLTGDHDAVVFESGVAVLESTLYAGETRVGKEPFTDIKTVLDDILVAISIVETLPVNQTDATHLILVRGDAYDDVSRPKLSWDVGQDVTGNTIVVTFKDAVDGTLLFSTAGTGLGDIITVELTSAETELLIPTPRGLIGFINNSFDIEVDMGGGSYWTPVFGTYEVIGDVTLPADR